MIISLSIEEGAGGGGRKPFLIDYFSYSSVENPECFSRNIEANWNGKGGGGGWGQDNDMHNANIPFPSLFTEKLVLL